MMIVVYCLQQLCDEVSHACILIIGSSLAFTLDVFGTDAHGQGACMQYVHYVVLRFYQFEFWLL